MTLTPLAIIGILAVAATAFASGQAAAQSMPPSLSPSPSPASVHPTSRADVAGLRLASGPVQVGVQRVDFARAPLNPGLAFQDEGRPRWVKWGTIGAVAGAVAFAALGQSALDPNPVMQDAVVGAAIGFVILGGAIAFYDWVCKPDSSSERAGLC